VTVNRIFPHHPTEQHLVEQEAEKTVPATGMEALLKSVSAQNDDDERNGRFLFLIGNPDTRDLSSLLSELPEHLFDEIVLIDAGCSEQVIEQATLAGLQLVSAPQHERPGAIRKLCFDIAQRESANMLVLFELQHLRDLAALPAIVRLIDQEIWDVILGTRFDDFLPMSKRSQQHPHQIGPRRGKQLIADVFYGQRLVDPDTDFLACRVHPLWVLPYHENNDSRIFSWQFIAQTLGAGFRIGELPLRVTPSKHTVPIPSDITFADRWSCLKTVFKSWMKRFRIWRKEAPIIPPIHPDVPPAPE